MYTNIFFYFILLLPLASIYKNQICI
jgi:hypothetical protein